MQKEPVQPTGAGKKEHEPSGSDAAAMTARLLALKGDSDEYNYAEPPASSAPPVVPPKVKRRSRLITYVGAAALLAIGAFAGRYVEKHRVSPPVAIVNGEIITAEDFAHASEIPSGRAAFQRLLDDTLVLQFAKKKGVIPDQKTLDAKFTEATRLPDFYRRLKVSNQTTDDFRHALLVLLCKQAIIGDKIKVNPSEVKAYYDRNSDRTNPRARFFHRESVQVQVVITRSEQAAQDAKSELDAKAPFLAVVNKYSTDISKARGGVLQPIPKGTIDSSKFPGLDKILFDMQQGNQQGPVKIGDNWWIIRCLAHDPETTDPFEKVEEQCTIGLLTEMGLKKNGQQLKKEEEQFVKASSIDIPAKYQSYADLSPKH